MNKLSSKKAQQLLSRQTKLEKILRDDMLATHTNVKQLYATTQSKIAAQTTEILFSEIYSIPGIMKPA